MKPKDTIDAFDAYLAERGLNIDAVVIGGAALGLLGVAITLRSLDLDDCVALAPTTAELEEIAPWLEEQDANPDWPAHTRAVISDLRRRLNHGI